MRMPKRSIIYRMRECYPEGSRVELDFMEKPQAPPKGTRGTVLGVDLARSIIVDWDNGSELNVTYGVDKCHPVHD